MSAFIGSVNGPRHNSPNVAVHVSCSVGGVEVSMTGPLKTLDPIGARVLAALLIQASKEVEMMRAREKYPNLAAAQELTRRVLEGLEET